MNLSKILTIILTVTILPLTLYAQNELPSKELPPIVIDDPVDYQKQKDKWQKQLDKFNKDQKNGLGINGIVKGETILYHAVSANALYVVEKLFAKGVDINKLSPEKIVPLHMQSKHPSVRVSFSHNSPFIEAISNRYYLVANKYIGLKIVKLFLDRGVDVNLKPSRQSNLPLLEARCNVELIELLLEYGANPKLDSGFQDSVMDHLLRVCKKDQEVHSKMLKLFIKYSKNFD